MIIPCIFAAYGLGDEVCWWFQWHPWYWKDIACWQRQEKASQHLFLFGLHWSTWRFPSSRETPHSQRQEEGHLEVHPCSAFIQVTTSETHSQLFESTTRIHTLITNGDPVTIPKWWENILFIKTRKRVSWSSFSFSLHWSSLQARVIWL